MQWRCFLRNMSTSSPPDARLPIEHCETEV
jgi:hypothetical protein